MEHRLGLVGLQGLECVVGEDPAAYGFRTVGGEGAEDEAAGVEGQAEGHGFGDVGGFRDGAGPEGVVLVAEDLEPGGGDDRFAVSVADGDGEEVVPAPAPNISSLTVSAAGSRSAAMRSRICGESKKPLLYRSWCA
ncbi:hypothetical protein, partial [Streptomyces mangrovisoli]|uniref:hypothetical protein n=1 Tax=Streptomyces mangrovisoli TaxID=1428628 RepID=UPI0011606DBC